MRVNFNVILKDVFCREETTFFSNSACFSPHLSHLYTCTKSKGVAGQFADNDDNADDKGQVKQETKD